MRPPIEIRYISHYIDTNFVVFLNDSPGKRIYHNVALRAPRKRPQGVSDGKPVKQATNHPKTRQKRAGSVFTACMSMHASA